MSPGQVGPDMLRLQHPDGALLIQQAGIHLKCPQVLLTTASVLFHRFFYVSSMKNFGVKVCPRHVLAESRLCMPEC